MSSTKINTIALGFGYAEDHCTSWLIFHTDVVYFTSKQEALHSLVTYLYKKYVDERILEDKHKSYMKQCCYHAWNIRDQNIPNPTKCPVCEACYERPLFDEENWGFWLLELQRSTCDLYGDNNCHNPHLWDPWLFEFKTPPEQVLVVDELAEIFLSMALREAVPETQALFSSNNAPDYVINQYRQLLDL